MIKGVDYIGVNVVFYCHDAKGNLLLNKRSNKCRDEIGCWDPGGGAIEFGETFEEAVRREVKEEYCVNIIKINYITTQNVLRHHNGKKTHWVTILFAVQVEPNKVKIGDSEKIDEIGWFTLNNLPKPLHSMFHKHVAFVKRTGLI